MTVINIVDGRCLTDISIELIIVFRKVFSNFACTANIYNTNISQTIASITVNTPIIKPTAPPSDNQYLYANTINAPLSKTNR